MPLELVAYTPAHVRAVCEFNQRLRKGGASKDDEFPETPHPGWLPEMELYVVKDDDAVRGGYILRRHTFFVSRETQIAAHYRLPVSEGVIDRNYTSLGLRLVRDALARRSRLYVLGMGSWDRPLPRMLKAMKWRLCEVPFHFKVVRPARFLRNIRPLRTSALRRMAFDAAAATGAGWLGMKALSISRRLPRETMDTAPSFTGWADEVWQRSREAYPLIGVRDAATLERLYPPADPRFLRVRAAGGWALLLDTQMSDHKQFGDMRVGTIVDCLAPPRDAAAVTRAATSLLESRGVDLIVSNQMHAAWSQGLLASGFRKGPSNFLLGLSPEFAKLVATVPETEFHFNRGDGDGPIHL